MAPKVSQDTLVHDLLGISVPHLLEHFMNKFVVQKNAAKVETAEEKAARLEKEALAAQEAAKLRQEAARARILERHLREQVGQWYITMDHQCTTIGHSCDC